MFADANCPSKCNADSYAYEYTQCYTNGYSHGYSEHYAYCYGYIHADAQCYSNSYSYGYGQTNAYREAQRNSEATSHTAAAPLRNVTNYGYGTKHLPALVSWRGDSGERVAAGWFRRPRRNDLSWRFVAGLNRVGREVRDGEDAIANTRDACAPQNIA